MKKCLVVLLLFFAGLTLFAQQDQPTMTMPGATVFIPAITGTGNLASDNQYFSQLIHQKLEERNYAIVLTPLHAALFITATITPYTLPAEVQSVLYQDSRQIYVLSLIVQESATGVILTQHSLYYTEAEEITDLLSLIFDGFPRAPEPPPPDAWRSMPWNFGAFAYWAPRIYAGDSVAFLYGNFSIGLTAEYQFKNNLSLGTGLGFLPDWVSATELMGVSYRDVILELPLSVKYSFKPQGNSVLSPYAGIGFNISLLRETKPPLLNWKVGFQYGTRTGRGMVVLDTSFAMDIGRAALTETWARDIQYQRLLFQVGVGYRYGTEKFPWFRRKNTDNNTMEISQSETEET